MTQHVTRRGFLTSSLRAGAGLTILAGSASALGYAANEALNVALVGLGGRGNWFVGCIPSLGQNVVAVCDVNEQKAAAGFQRFSKAKKFHDFRKMLDEAQDLIEAVVVATPDHIHAPCSVCAMEHGKPVYCEKPLTNTVHESRVMRETARRQNVATQMGNQGTASGQYRRAVELIQSGTIGEVREVLVWKDSGGPDWTETPKDSMPEPDYLEWDLWLGPAPARPYHRDWMRWHGWREFGTCSLGNWAPHTANLAFRALKFDTLWNAEPAQAPRIRLEAEVARINRLSFPRWEVVRYEVPARGDLPPVKFTWYNGGGKPGMRDEIESRLGRKLDWGDAGRRKWDDHAGTVIVGSKGKIYSNGHNTVFNLLPGDQFKDFQGPEPWLPRSRGHEREWLDACRGGPPAMSNFDYAGPLCEFLLLGNVATQFQGPLEYDPLACKITNNAEADAALKRGYRPGWEL